MTTNKDFKRLVRGRMKKTGESYTAARARLAEKTKPPAAPDHSSLAGIPDASVEAKTGRGWAAWVRALDAAKAHEWKHGDIARHVRETWGVSSWWSQTVAVGYQRIKGKRVIGQRHDGGFAVARSKTVPVPVAVLYRQFSDKRRRARWLPGVDLTVRTARADTSMRITWPDGSAVQAFFQAKGAEKSTVHIDHGKLADKAAVERTGAFWKERLAALAALLA